MSPADIELLELFIEGKLSASENSAVENRLKEDAAFRELHDDLLMMIKGIRASGQERLKQKMKGWSASPKSSRTLPFSAILPAAALLVVLIGATVWWLSRDNADYSRQLFTQYFEYPEAPPIARGIADLKVQAYAYYTEGRYDEALSALEAYVAGNPDTEAEFYLGVLLIAKEKPDPKGIQYLQRASGASDNLTAKWYLALGHLHSDHIAECSALLTELSSYQNPFQQKSIQLLEELPK